MNTSTVAPKPNPTSQKRHQTEMIWQVFLPIALGSILTVGMFVFVLVGSLGANVNASVLADTTVIWFSLPMILSCFLGFALVAGMAYGVAWLCTFIPRYSGIAIDFLQKVSLQTRHYAKQVEKPVADTRAKWDVLEKNISQQIQKADRVFARKK
ncbi:MAG TPA: hypothetical protein PK299_05310 [Anaerolineales bacterium]|nr:hypothetical protein [Anaerolineales bacterium]